MKLSEILIEDGLEESKLSRIIGAIGTIGALGLGTIYANNQRNMDIEAQRATVQAPETQETPEETQETPEETQETPEETQETQETPEETQEETPEAEKVRKQKVENVMNTIRNLKLGSIDKAKVVDSIIDIESSYDPMAHNRGGHYGLMQLAVPTAEDMGFKGNPEELFKPDVNIILGVKYIQWCWNMVKEAGKFGDENRLYAMAAAYNGGIGTLKKLAKQYNTWDMEVLLPYHKSSETQNYIKKLKSRM